MQKLYEMLDGFVESFMKGFFDSFNEFWNNFFVNGGKGAYICFLLILIFVGILFLIGLFKVIRKFGLFIFITLITIGIPCLWYFVVMPKLG